MLALPSPLSIDPRFSLFDNWMSFVVFQLIFLNEYCFNLLQFEFISVHKKDFTFRRKNFSLSETILFVKYRGGRSSWFWKRG